MCYNPKWIYNFVSKMDNKAIKWMKWMMIF